MSVLGWDCGSHLRAGVNFNRRGFVLVAVVACGLAGAYGAPSAYAAFVSGLPDGVEVGNHDPATLIETWFDDNYECAGGSCNDENIQNAIEDQLGYDSVEYVWHEYDDEGGQLSEFMYDGLERSIFAVKSGLTVVVLVYDRAITGWTIAGLPHDVSNVSAVSPIPLPPAALLFLSGLAGMALLARRRRARSASAAVK